MKIDPGLWPVVSALLDAALDLPTEEDRQKWLRELPPAAQPHRETLERLLRDHAHVQTRDFLDAPAAMVRLAPRAPASRNEDAGRLVGPYRLLREIGRGGMGSVWLAERVDGLLKRMVALKLPHPGLADRGFAERLARERDILASLAHPHIARLYDAGVTADGQPFIALEYIEGKTIIEDCDTQRRDTRARIALFLQVLDAVQYAHVHLVIHRDLKPSNVLVDANAQVKLLDFGVAKLLVDGRGEATELTLDAGQALTPDFASPEQILGRPLSTASDVYSLGVLLYQLLTGVRPYRLLRDRQASLARAILAVDVPRPSAAIANNPAAADTRGTTPKQVARALRGDLDTIVLKALKTRPEERYGTVDALRADLQRHLKGKPVQARPESRLYIIRKFVARNRLAVGAAAVATVAVLAGAGGALWQARIAVREADRAEQAKSFLLDLFRSADPDEGQSGAKTTTELLLGARAQIEARFRDRPDITAALLSAVGYSLLGLGETNASIDLLQSAVDVADAHLARDDREALKARLRLGEALLKADRLEEARVALERALAGFRRIDDVQDLVETLRWKSRLHSMRRENDAAIREATAATALARARLGPEGLQTRLNAENEMLSALAVARRGGQLEPARLALDLTEALHAGKIVWPVLTAREAYGTAMVSEGSPAEGVRILQATLSNAADLFGPHHRLVAYFAGRLFRGRLIDGDIDGALESARLARETWDTVHASEPHSDRAFGRLYEGAALMAAHRFADARQPLTEAAAMFERFEGPRGRIAGIARAGLAVALMGQGDLAAAESAFDPLPESMDTYESASVTARFGLLRRLQGRPEEAERLLRAAIEFFEKQTNERYELAIVRAWLAATLMDRGRAEDAKVLIDNSLAVLTTIQSRMSPVQAEACETLARIELALGREQAAANAASRAVEFWQAFNPTTAAAGRARLLQARAMNAI